MFFKNSLVQIQTNRIFDCIEFTAPCKYHTEPAKMEFIFADDVMILPTVQLYININTY